MKVALIPGSFKPLHRGHWNLITTASKECERVLVSASTTDRDNIKGTTMAKIWCDIIVPKLPDNVTVTVLPNLSPIRHAYAMMDPTSFVRHAYPDAHFVLYGDPQDLEGAFAMDKLKKYLPDLVECHRVSHRPVGREETFGISGTQMRDRLRRGDKAAFIADLPDVMDHDRIWDLLHT
jgi:cytidyltransferase-like protein